MANESMLRYLIAAETLCYISFLVLALALHGLLASTGRWAAMLMATLAVSSVPFGFANVAQLLEILNLAVAVS